MSPVTFIENPSWKVCVIENSHHSGLDTRETGAKLQPRPNHNCLLIYILSGLNRIYTLTDNKMFSREAVVYRCPVNFYGNVVTCQLNQWLCNETRH